MIQEIFRMLNQFEMEIPTLPVDQCHSHLIRYLKGCWGILSYRRAAKKSRQAFGTHMVNREMFLQIHMHLHQLLILKNCINGIHQSKRRSIRRQWRKVKSNNKTKNWDNRLDHQSKIRSSSVEETLQRIVVQTNNDCRFRIFIATNSTHRQCLLVGRSNSRPRYALVHNFLRKLCNGSKKWRWLIQWMIRHLWKEFECQILSTRCKDCCSTEHNHHNSHFKRRVSLEEQKVPKEDRFLRGTSTTGSLGAMILSRTTPTYSLSVYEMMIFKNSIQSGSDFFNNDKDSTWWYLGTIVLIKNTRVWETQGRIGIVRHGDSSEEIRTWLSQIENYGEEKYRARYSK